MRKYFATKPPHSGHVWVKRHSAPIPTVSLTTLRIGAIAPTGNIHPKQPVARRTTSIPHLMYTNSCDSCDFANWPMLFVVYRFRFHRLFAPLRGFTFRSCCIFIFGIFDEQITQFAYKQPKILAPIVIPIYYSYYLSSLVTDFFGFPAANACEQRIQRSQQQQVSARSHLLSIFLKSKIPRK